MSTVTVVKDGNQREGAMTTDEFNQCIHDIKSWFCRSGLSVDRFGHATSADFQRLNKAVDTIPNELHALLSECNGGLWYGEKIGLSTEGIIDLVMELSSLERWNDHLLPFCGDASGLLAINKKTGKVIEWDCDEGSGDVEAESFGAYIEQYRNSLLGGKFEYFEDVGVIERVTASKVRK